jgi:hypothetical protein
MIIDAIAGKGAGVNRTGPQLLSSLKQRKEFQLRGRPNGAAIARALGVPERTVRGWLRDGFPKPARDRDRATDALRRFYRRDALGSRREARIRRGTLHATWDQVNNASGEIRERDSDKMPSLGWDQGATDHVVDVYLAGGSELDVLRAFMEGIGDDWYRGAILPNEDVDEEDWDDYYDEYGADAPEGDDEYADAGWAWTGVSFG